MADSKWTPPPGRVGNLTPEQQKTLDEFRTELQNEGHFVADRHDDPTLLRFLRARKFDIAAAKTMFIACETWRKDFGVDELRKNGYEFPEKLEVDKYYPQYYHKMDKDGRPIYIERLGPLDVNALYKLTTQERLLKRLVWEYEKFLVDRLPACSAAIGHPVETSCTILDLKGVGMGQFWKVKDYIAQASNIGQNYYPECMGKFYIINAPMLFSTVWSVTKGWLDPVTVAKIDILGSSYKDTLLKNIPPESLPDDLGGTCKCSPSCSLSDEGPWKKSPAAPAKTEGA
ncbi:putative SEC14-phosphatidylinositol/phosphatidylcholine transfer protein [Exidia glandulosa HHB12029]|uniref:Putative SEC14-phosphatidylinositol/phosphatidylcholine transfer protein n=1 Tax=Exidia glandulosa HHB12029 TaxID=1314781 RepID=A0A165ERZ2_EXIGL|nr:putative SEC14-phosphatidylinositol/phosphatidylcholine transfer protein [Exidia glandulosa HHB12029]